MKSKNIRLVECYLSQTGSVLKVCEITVKAKEGERYGVVNLGTGKKRVVSNKEFRSSVRDRKGNMAKEVLKLSDEVLVREGFVLSDT